MPDVEMAAFCIGSL